MLFKKLQEAKKHICNINTKQEDDNTYQCDYSNDSCNYPLPNSLDPDFDVYPVEKMIVGMDYPQENIDVVNNEFTESVPVSSKEESMDVLHKMECERKKIPECKFENVYNFLEKYANIKNEDVQAMRNDLILILSDVQYIRKYDLKNTQWAMDFADALNELSVAF